MHRRFSKLVARILLVCCTLTAPHELLAQTPQSGLNIQTSPSDALPYSATRGRWDFGAQVGYSLEYGLDWHEVSHIQMLIAQPQIGYILHDFQRSPLRRFEVIDEGILGAAVHPGRSYLAGDAVLFRLEGKERGRWVPFLDAGAGVQRTPLFRHAPEVDGFTQFTPQGGIGLEYFVAPQRAVVVEFRTVHMSNADLVPPNMGFNSGMITVGFRWLRRPVRPGDRASH